MSPHAAIPAVAVERLTKRYGDVTAVNGMSFEVNAGEVFGFLGPNGAGKTTTINMLCTLVQPTGGTARVAGHDIVTERDAVRHSIGVVFQEPTVDAYLSAEQNLRFHAALYGMPAGAARRRIDHVLELVDLTASRGRKVQTFSGGMRRRLEIARGLLHLPRVLFLDEPTLGLDPQARVAIWEHVNELRRSDDLTIFLTTHYMEEAEYCDRIAIIDHGQIVVLDTPEALKTRVGTDRVQIETQDDKAAIAALRERLSIDAAIHEGRVTFSVMAGEEFVPRLFATLGVPIKSVHVARPSLDDVFLSYSGRTLRDAEAHSDIDLRRLTQRR
jgi:ABC-2 type transport system ATP-binding protein